MMDHDYEPDSILLDFEQATIKSIKKSFPGVTYHGMVE